MKTLIVDWLGRGGIAHCTEAWASTLSSSGADVLITTRPGRELNQALADVRTSPAVSNPVLAHLSLCRHTARVILEERPDLVVIQNYLIPPFESTVLRAAQKVGSRGVLVVHDHRLHSVAAGTRAGLRHLVHRADTVLSHSHFVADAVAEHVGGQVEVEVLPLPVQTGVVEGGRAPLPFPPPAGLLALHFGIIRRSYKGTNLVAQLAQDRPPGWEIVVAGAGAPAVPGAIVVSRFLDAAELATAVEAADVILLPYRFATQSGAVVLAQALGSVVVTTDVGGLAEQVRHGECGLLVTEGGGVAAWRAALERVSDSSTRERLAAAARAKVWDDHRAFEKGVLNLASIRR